MLVEITSPDLGYKVGEIVTVKDAIGRAYIGEGQAKESDELSAMRYTMRAEFATRDADLKTTLEEIKNVQRNVRPNPPVVKQGEFTSTTAADRDNKMTLGDITRCMYWRKAYGDDPNISENMAKFAVQKLDHIWKLQRTEWNDNSEAHISRDNPHGVARDGAESTQGAPTYGYLVRPEFMPDVFRIEAETDVMTNLREIPMGQSIEMHYPALDQYASSAQTRTSNYFGGVTLYRKPEDAARTSTDSKLSEIIFKATDLTALTKVSRDLMADSFVNINAFLGGLFREAFGWRRDWDFLLGTGAGEPQGIWGSACEISGGPNSSARTTSSHIRYEDVAWMMSKMLPQARRGAYWIVNAQAGSDIQSILAASPSAFAYQPNALVSQAQWPSIYGNTAFDGILLGLPIKYTEKAPALGSQRDITLFAPKYYGEATKQGLEIAISYERYFENDQVGIRWKLRNDGQPMLKSYFTGYDSNTYSPIVSLK